MYNKSQVSYVGMCYKFVKIYQAYYMKLSYLYYKL